MNNASLAHEEQKEAILDLLASMMIAVEEGMDSESVSWAHVGSLQHVKTLLRQAMFTVGELDRRAVIAGRRR